jgi:hypothetical protein
MKRALREDITRTKSRNSTFFSGKRRSIVAFFVIMVYMLTPVEGRIIRHGAGDRGAEWVNRGINHNQRANPRKNGAGDNNKKKEEEGQDRKDLATIIIAGAGGIVAIGAAVLAVFIPQPQAQQDRPQPQAQRPKPQAPQPKSDSEDAPKSKGDSKSKSSKKKSKSKLPKVDREPEPEPKLFGFGLALGPGGGCGGIPVRIPPVLDAEMEIEGMDMALRNHGIVKREAIKSSAKVVLEELIDREAKQILVTYQDEFEWFDINDPEAGLERIRMVYRDVVDLAWLRVIYGGDMPPYPPANYLGHMRLREDVNIIRIRVRTEPNFLANVPFEREFFDMEREMIQAIGSVGEAYIETFVLEHFKQVKQMKQMK